MKILWAVLLAMSLLLISGRTTDAYGPYYELHMIHYQLYRPRYYPVYYRPYVVSPIPVFIVDRNPRAIRFVPATRRR